MALYEPDLDMQEAIKVVSEIKNTTILYNRKSKKERRNYLIKYYIEEHEKQIEQQIKELEEYREFFNKLDKFLPDHNPTIY